MLREKYPVYIALASVLFSVTCYLVFNVSRSDNAIANQYTNTLKDAGNEHYYASSSQFDTDSHKHDIANLKKQIVELKSEFLHLAEQQHHREGASEDSSGAVYSQSDSGPASSPDEEDLSGLLARQKATYEAELAVQAADLEWADETLVSVADTFQKPDLSGLDYVEGYCAATLCKITVAANGSLPIEESMQVLSWERPWNGSTFFTADKAGTISLFFAREGHELPPVE